jgi:hypothetical protein
MTPAALLVDCPTLWHAAVSLQRTATRRDHFVGTTTGNSRILFSSRIPHGTFV